MSGLKIFQSPFHSLVLFEKGGSFDESRESQGYSPERRSLLFKVWRVSETSHNGADQMGRKLKSPFRYVYKAMCGARRKGYVRQPGRERRRDWGGYIHLAILMYGPTCVV